MSQKRKPSFFIVGAPKCGTTALNDYLAEHPDIFMAKKEIHYFGSDLLLKQDHLSEKDYLDFFKEGEQKKLWGESSVWYLYSKNAAAEIKRFSPDAKVIIMLREPVEMLSSLHSQHLFDGNEDVTDFETAIRLDQNREKGTDLPQTNDFLLFPLYKNVVRYAEQVQRYFDVFGKKNVQVILYDDMKNNMEQVYISVLDFLELDNSHRPDFRIINPNKTYKSYHLHNVFKNANNKLRSLSRIIIPSKKIRSYFSDKVYEWNLKHTPRKAMSETLSQELKSSFRAEILALSKLIDRDLSIWLK